MIQKKITFDSFIRGILTAMVIIGILYLVNRLSGVLLPFFIAWLIAYLIYPMVIFFQNKLRLRNRVISILVVLLVLLSIITLAFVGLVPPIIEEFGKLKELLTAYFIEGSKQAAIPGTVANFIKEHIDMLKIHEALNESNFANTMRNVLPQVWALLTQSVNIVFSVFTSFIILLYTFFILLDYEAIARGWIKLIPARHREMTVHIVTDVQDGMNKYFRGQAFVAFCVGILFSIGFLIIDFPLAIGFGLFIGLLNMVPYLQLIAFIPTVLISLTEGCGYRREFLVDIILRLPCVLHRTNYTRRSDCTESYGKNHRIESCYHFIIPLRLGGINGNCRYDYRFALYQLDAFLLSKIHTNKRKRIFRRDRTH